MARAIDGANDGVAPLDHVGEPVHVVLDTAIVVLEFGLVGFSHRTQMGNHRISAANVKNATSCQSIVGPVDFSGQVLDRDIRACNDLAMSPFSFNFDPGQVCLGLTSSRPRNRQRSLTLRELVVRRATILSVLRGPVTATRVL
jgi:hypothetical protein